MEAQMRITKCDICGVDIISTGRYSIEMEYVMSNGAIVNPTKSLDACENCYEQHFSKFIKESKKINPMDAVVCVPLPTKQENHISKLRKIFGK
jgi:hypothetical protein